ncbi:MAG: tripartite tricarboxylate transporter substrate binding protein [Betaproteobacteria bacterium]|jgi:tripartite-type tricarboxylate transporter receptor subunit TctC|nr:tripartite tricarboxylate transporter substrate binding protein [Betaproteobacteria bacterium]
MMKKHVTLLMLLLPLASAVAAQSYPAKPVRMIVPFPPGGPTDIVTRLMAPKMAAALSQQVVVENRAGAGGMIATEQVAKAAPDGYTIIMGTIGGMAVAMSLSPNRGYDTLRDFAPITQSVAVTSILVTHPSVPAKNVRELLNLAKKTPGKLNYASSGNGTVTHLAGELLKLLGKVDIVHVPYKGGAPALTALVSGEVDMSYENSLIITPHIKSGRVKALAVTGAKRSALLPDLPTIAETLPGYSASGWYGLFAPAATPKPVLARLNAEAVKALRAADVADKLSGQGAEPIASSAEEFTAFVRSEIDKWANVVKAARMRTD